MALHSNDQDLKSRARAFRELHDQSNAFVLPCAWDAFSALLFEQAGFACVGTTSGGVNWVNGRRDYVYTTPRSEMLRAYGEIARATSLPVSADLENGYGDDAADVADTILTSIDEGMVAGSIEDQCDVPTDDLCTNGTLFDKTVAVNRIRAAREAADSSAIQYTLTARCEVYYTSCKNPFAEAVDRLNAYSEAGADCLFAPGLNDLSELEALVKEVDGPISFGMGATEKPLTVAMLEDIGVRRISTGGGLTRAVLGLLQRASTEIAESGEFGYLDDALSEKQINEIFEQR